MTEMKELFERNLTWSNSMKEKDPDFFLRLLKQQKPEYLWIGCSDSRVPANQIVDLPPGEVFVHRNIANVVAPGDLNCLSVVQFAVEVLKVKNIIVCGHYNCGGIRAALESEPHGLIDNWLTHIRDVIDAHRDELTGLPSESSIDLLCELNVKRQVYNLCQSSILQNAWANGADVTVHGLIYSIKNGILKDLNTSVSANP